VPRSTANTPDRVGEMVVRVVAIVQTAVKGAAEHLAEIDAGKRVGVPSVGDPPENHVVKSKNRS